MKAFGCLAAIVGVLMAIIRRYVMKPEGLDNKTEDWVHGDRVPLFDDFVIPRARKRLVTGPQDLPALRHLLTPPDIGGDQGL